jgi:starch synthase
VRRLKIQIGVGGRFHADRLAKAFLDAGHHVSLLTSYPANRFVIVPSTNIQSHLISELLYRGCRKLGIERAGEQAKMITFGRWLDRRLAQEPADVSFIWSSFARESFAHGHGGHRILVRDSTHIVHQCAVLSEESAKFGIIYHPDVTCVNRELEEYEKADTIAVLSHFAKKTFVDRGIAAKKIRVFSLGVDTSTFQAPPREAITGPLEILYFGTISIRKGVQYLLEATKDLPHVRVTLVGPIEDSFRSILGRYSHYQYLGPQTHAGLAAIARTKHLYVFPSLEDGFPNTLIQAMASGLVPITTAQCGPAEWIEDGTHGFLIPPADADALRDRLAAIAAQPAQLLPMGEAAAALARRNSWTTYANQFQNLLHELFDGGAASPTMSAPRSPVTIPTDERVTTLE